MAKAITQADIIARWSGLDRPLFTGKLISPPSEPTVCYCAQGDILHVAGWSDAELRAMTQVNADAEVAKLLGISRTHSVLLRNINDSTEGCPQDVLAAPEKILGPNASTLLKFWQILDTFTPQQWAAARTAAWTAAGTAAWTAAGTAAWTAAEAAVGTAAWTAAGAAAGAAVGTSNEIQGESELTKFFFLPMFGFATPQAVRDFDLGRGDNQLS